MLLLQKDEAPPGGHSAPAAPRTPSHGLGQEQGPRADDDYNDYNDSALSQQQRDAPLRPPQGGGGGSGLGQRAGQRASRPPHPATGEPRAPLLLKTPIGVKSQGLTQQGRMRVA